MMTQRIEQIRGLGLWLGLLAWALLLVACDQPACETEPGLVTQSTAAQAPSIGQINSTDVGDRSCGLVMRELSRLRDDQGEFLQACDEAGCHFVWQGKLDVASHDLGPETSVAVLYHMQGETDWWQVPAWPDGPGGPGFLRFSFRVDAHLPGPDMDAETLMASAIEFIPFVERADGTRVFDHNRNPGDFDNYLARGDRGLYLGPDPAVCNHRPQTGAIQFGADWREYALGELRAGGQVAIHYDLARLPDCAGEGAAADWDLTAFVQVDGGGPLLSGSVVGMSARDGGQGEGQAGRVYSWPLLLELPEDAQALTIWFMASSPDGCQAYDSDFGLNYHFDLAPSLASDPCAEYERWDDRYGGGAACPDYQIDEQFDASNCEFALQGLGDGYEGHYGIPFRWVEATLWIGQTDGEVLNAGLYVAYQDHSDATSGQRWIFGRPNEDGSMQTGFNYLFTGYMGSGSYRYTIERFAFFLDVLRPDGAVQRLWQSRQGQNYDWSDAFSLTTDTHYIPYGRIEYANRDAVVFDGLRACR